jgi:hypothetical protein
MLLLAADTKPLQALAWIFIIGIGAVVFMIGLSTSDFILRMACRTAGAPVPDTGRAMVVSFLETIAGTAAWFFAGLTLSAVGLATRSDTSAVMATIGFSVISIMLFVPAGLYVPMLRVTFQKGLAIAVLRYVIMLVLAVGLSFVIVAAGKVRI